MKVLLFHYFISDNPYFIKKQPEKDYVSKFTGKKEYPITFETLSTDGVTYDQKAFKIKELDCWKKVIRSQIFCGYIAETGELGYMVLPTNKKNEIFILFNNFYDFRYSSVKVKLFPIQYPKFGNLSNSE